MAQIVFRRGLLLALLRHTAMSPRCPLLGSGAVVPTCPAPRSITCHFATHPTGSLVPHQNVLVAPDLFLRAGRHLLFEVSRRQDRRGPRLPIINVRPNIPAVCGMIPMRT